ncbi:MAG: SNARE domain protein [Sylvanvirus sp.]|uniref:SNARE domain protein n=1 Tax=Sylvanvirus sp. TaxID=2487774 RepID=A0A3G5AIX9_9VIRU|nr:MAG: SNARE domain protein [Sylvanvirus sp.]
MKGLKKIEQQLYFQSLTSYSDSTFCLHPHSSLAMSHQLLLLDDQLSCIEYQDDTLIQRTGEIHNIEQQVTQVADLFKDLQSITYQQQEYIDTIVDNIESTKNNTVSAEKELIDAKNHQENKRKRRCCCGTIFVTVVGIIILAIVIVSK